MDMTLCVGGPLEGKWVRVYPSEPWFEAVETGDLALSPEPPEIKKVVYRVDTVILQGWQVKVAVAEEVFESGLDRDAAVLRALLQRDVADAMNIPRRLR